MARSTYPLPDIIEPEGDKCVPFYFPDDPDYQGIILAQLRKLTLQHMYDRDENQSGQAVASVMNDRMYIPLLDRIIIGNGCDLDTLGQCFRMDTATEAFSYYPNDPFTGADQGSILSGGELYRWGGSEQSAHPIFNGIADIINILTGYYPNDVMVFPSDIFTNPFTNFDDYVSLFTSFPFPYVHVELEGAGQFEVELVNVPFGGSAWIIPDTDITNISSIVNTIIDFIDNDGTIPANWIVTEVDRDISIPPEIAPTQTQEIEFATGGEHSVTILFIPRLDDEFPFVFPLGGIREIEMCGNITVIGSQTGNTIDKLTAGASAAMRQGAIMTTSEELCNAVECGFERIAQRIVSGQSGNFVSDVTIGEDGTITVAPVGGSGGIAGTTEQQLSGAVREVRIGLDQFLTDFESYYQTYGTALTTPQTFLKSKYLTDEALLDQAYADYVTYREGASPVLSPFGVNLDQYLFCDGVTKQVVNAYIIDELATDDLLQIQIVDSLLTDQFGVWYDDGILKPQDEYLPFPCVRREEWTVEYTAAQFIADTPVYLDAPTGFAHYPTDRRVRITLSGKFVDSMDSGNTSDPFYRTESGVSGATPQVYDRFRLDNGNGSTTFIVYPDTIPAYDPDGNYSWIVIVNEANYNDFYINENITANDAWRSDATGSIMITITDLGEA